MWLAVPGHIIAKKQSQSMDPGNLAQRPRSLVLSHTSSHAQKENTLDNEGRKECGKC